MKKKHRQFFRTIFWLFVVVAVLWIAFAPPVPKHKLASVQVKVEPPPPLPEPPTPEQLQSGPSVGDEKAETQIAGIVPPPVPELAVKPPVVPGGPPKIAVVIDDMGLDIRGSKRAVSLPSYVTLSYMPYATRLGDQTKDARAAGHELLLHMPMEPMGHEDPGPGALLSGLPQEELKRRFDTALASFVGFDGVNNHMGSKFTADVEGMKLVVGELQERHLFFLDSRTSSKTIGEALARQSGLPTIGRDIFLDDDMAIDAVRSQMEQAERVARRKGYAVVIGHPHSATLTALEEWLPNAASRGFVFVPLNELVGKP